MLPPLEAQPPPPPPTEPPEPVPYVYAATDIRPRQAREVELCMKASSFDWQYTGGFFLAHAASIYLNIQHFKQSEQPGVRMFGPGLVGFTWGAFLSGGYLSLPKCDPLWSQGPPPEGNVRLDWPLAVTISVIAGVTAPVMDFAFLGPVKPDWTVTERSIRVFVGAGAGILGSIFPYFVSPKTWSARKEIDRMRIEGSPAGVNLTYTVRF